MFGRTALLALTMALCVGAQAQATTTVVNAVLDRPHVFPGPSDRSPTYYTQFLNPSFAFEAGDTLDVTLTFPGGAPLNLGFLPADVTFTVFGGGGYAGSIYQTTGTLNFINPTGDVKPLTGPQTGVFDRNPAIVFTGVRQHQRGPLAFDGLHFVVHLDSVLHPAEPAPELRFSAFQVSFTNDVPEPATWMMLIVGFASVGTAFRRRRRMARAA